MKKLIRLKPINLKKEHEYDRLIESDRVMTDVFLSRHFEIHQIEMTPEEMKLPGISLYFRDNMAEVGNSIIINKSLLPDSLDLLNLELFKKQFLIALFEGLKKKPIPSDDNSCHAAFYLESEDFILVSSKMSMGEYEVRVLGLDKPYYIMHQVSTPFSVGVQSSGLNYFNKAEWDSANGHIDTRIGIVEEAKIIYVTPSKGPNLKGFDIFRKENDRRLEDIASEFGYEIREYPYNPMMIEYLTKGVGVLPKSHRKYVEKFGAQYILGSLINGINFITDGDKLFTSYISDDEKKHLRTKGVNAITVPINYSLNGAGLRCVYGEISKL